MLHRTIMLQVEARIHALITGLTASEQTPDVDHILRELTLAKEAVHEVAHSVVDYQEVVDNLDDNILVADKDEVVLYVNDAYAKNTGIAPEEILGHRISDLLQTGSFFTDPTVPEVIQKRKKVMKLSSMFGKPNSLGFVTGVPIFEEDGEIRYVVACNRGVSTFRDLRDNFVQFVSAINSLQSAEQPVQFVADSSSVTVPSMIGESQAVKHIYTLLKSVSLTDATVLVTGESGVGKEVIADAIYRNSSRAEMPFIKVNCASIPAALFESELFGYERGAFSGANAAGKQGLFEAANHGTLMLDEIGEMPLDMQAKLLRAIQSNEITRVGGVKPIRLDIRYIAATNCDLKQKVREGTFRNDLYYRLHVIPLKVPPLRERKGDVTLLCQHFVSAFNQQYRKSVVLTPENLELLESYSWPGNIRELRNVMEYLVVCCSDQAYIDNSFIYGTFDLSNQNAYVEYSPDQSLNDAVDAYEKKYMENTLRYARSLKEASQILNVDPSTVSRKLRQHGLTLPGK